MPNPHLYECHCLADSQSMVIELSNNSGTNPPGILSAGLSACKAGSLTEGIRGPEKLRLCMLEWCDSNEVMKRRYQVRLKG